MPATMTSPRAVLAAALLALASPAAAQDSATTRTMIVGDPAAPIAGARNADVTIVAYLDYNCGYCKASAPALERLVKSDRGVKVVYKDWPILGASSVYGAKLALAAHRQGKYGAAHAALMALKGAKIPPEDMRAAVAKAGVDMARLDADAKAHDAEITALLKRNDAQATGMGFQGTPVYLVGPLLVAEAPDDERFKAAVAIARERARAR